VHLTCCCLHRALAVLQALLLLTATALTPLAAMVMHSSGQTAAAG
jgi:hypothetical protein